MFRLMINVILLGIFISCGDIEANAQESTLIIDSAIDTSFETVIVTKISVMTAIETATSEFEYMSTPTPSHKQSSVKMTMYPSSETEALSMSPSFTDTTATDTPTPTDTETSFPTETHKPIPSSTPKISQPDIDWPSGETEAILELIPEVLPPETPPNSAKFVFDGDYEDFKANFVENLKSFITNMVDFLNIAMKEKYENPKVYTKDEIVIIEVYEGSTIIEWFAKGSSPEESEFITNAVVSAIASNPEFKAILEEAVGATLLSTAVSKRSEYKKVKTSPTPFPSFVPPTIKIDESDDSLALGLGLGLGLGIPAVAGCIVLIWYKKSRTGSMTVGVINKVEDEGAKDGTFTQSGEEPAASESWV